MNTTCPITGLALPPVPEFATPVIACTGNRIAKQGHCSNPHPLVEHCGGCGWKHEHETYEHVGEFETPAAALRAAGRRRGHVGYVVLKGSYQHLYVCAGPCCRNARESAEFIGGHRPDYHAAGSTWSIADPAEAAAYDRYWESYERRYASAAALGL